MRVTSRVLSAVICVGFLVALTITGRAVDVPQPTFSSSPVRSTLTLALPAPVPNPYWPTPEFSYGLSNGRDVTIGDLDGDGLNDIIVKPMYLHFHPEMQPRFWINVGNGQFEDRTAALVDGAVPAVAVANSTFVTDFNGDGRVDVFFVTFGLEDKPVGGFDGGRNIVMLSQPDGRLKDTTATSLRINDVTTNHVSSMADVDGNGAMDVFIQRLGGSRVPGSGALLALNDGAGTFNETIRGLPREIAFLPTAQAGAVADRQAAGSTGACDLDGDRRTDIVTASYANNFYPKNVRVFQQSASSEFAERFRTPLPRGITDLAPGNTQLGAAGIICGDLNGDARNDLGIHWETSVGGSNFIQLLRNDGSFQFTDVTLDWFGTWDSSYAARGRNRQINGFEFRDLNRDGVLDFVPKIGGAWSPDMLWAGGFASLNDGTGRLQPMRYRPDNPGGTAADLNRILGCVVYCTFTPLVFDATGDGVTDLVLIDGETMKSRDLPYREDRVVLYTFAGSGS